MGPTNTKNPDTQTHTHTKPTNSTDYTEPYERWHKNVQQNACKLFYKISTQEQVRNFSLGVQGWLDVWKQGSANTINKEIKEKGEQRAVETQRFLKYWHLGQPSGCWNPDTGPLIEL